MPRRAPGGNHGFAVSRRLRRPARHHRHHTRRGGALRIRRASKQDRRPSPPAGPDRHAQPRPPRDLPQLLHRPSHRHHADQRVLARRARHRRPTTADGRTRPVLARPARPDHARRQHKTRPPEIVLHDQPPQPADACAALLALADQTLTAGDPDTAIHHLRDLADQAPLGPAWARRIIAVQERVSPGLQTALQPRLGRLARPTAGTVGSHLGPTRRGNFDHRHIPQRLPDAWFNRYVRHLQEGSHRLLRRAAAIRLVRMVNGGSYAQAGSHLGLSESATKTTLIQLSPWFRDKANSHAFTTALNALADELDAATALVDYGTRRQRLARWSIPPDEWRAITHGRGQTPPSRRGITDWGERKRRFVSWVVWTTITSSEHLFAPTTILPAHNPASRYGLRASLIGEWHAFHKHPWRHHAELAPIIHTYTNRVIHEIDGQPEVTDTPTIAPTLH